jgi:TPR repeat protein
MRGLLALAAALAPLALGLGSGARADEGEALYRDGHYERAIAHWRGRAEAGDVDAAYRLGATLVDGVVTQRDLPTAARWLEVAAEGGHLGAQLDIATLYDNGWGVVQSHARAAHWYRSAAFRGEMASQFNLASMYERGEGLERDPAAAYLWYYLSSRQGMGPLARDGLDRLASELSNDERSAIASRAAATEAAYDAPVTASSAGSQPPSHMKP